MRKQVLFGLAAGLALCLTSCVSTKKIQYFQGSDQMFEQAQAILQTYEMHLKPADQILIKVTCDNPELLEVFNLDVTLGAGSRNGGNLSYGTTGSMGSVYGYTIDNKGDVRLPVLGVVRVGGMTCDEAAKTIEQTIIQKNIIKNPDVTVRLLNARVAVLGAVKTPHVVSLTSERNTILDVLSQCGDLSDQGLREKVSLYREDNGIRQKYDLDLTQANIFESPAYYVQQNDLIYVQPNKSQNVRSSAFPTYLSASASILGLVSSITALVFAVLNFTNK